MDRDEKDQRDQRDSKPEVLFFGCDNYSPGHYLHAKREGGIKTLQMATSPWGEALDSGLIVESNRYGRADTTPTGEYVVGRKDGWTAIGFWDRSGADTRPGSNTAFAVHAEITAEHLISLARQQWPEIFGRPRFINLKPKPI